MMLKILYMDKDLVAVDKPAGLLVHRSEIDRRETRFALQMLRDQLRRYVYPVHRLDRPTSGVLIFALRRELVQPLAAAFARKEVSKSYLAVVRGHTAVSGTIDYPLPAISDKMINSENSAAPRARPAVTHYRTLGVAEVPASGGKFPTNRYSLLLVNPETGRRHQIRRHLRHISHPIIGDVKYGDGVHNRFFRQAFGVRRLLLCAVEISFPHPVHGTKITVRAPLDDDFRNLVRRFEWEKSLPPIWLNTAEKPDEAG